MIYLYPANKMEHLLALYLKIQHIDPLPIFEKETLVVQNAGMQHWLSMTLAQSRKISFNFSYALPAQFLWKLARTVAGEENVPDETLFSREVLSWRILALLSSESITQDPDFEQVTQFWRGEKSASLQQQRCYQLACQLADLYEQYLIYRPQWVSAWNNNDQNIFDEQTTSSAKSLMRWQAKLWQLLTIDESYDPQKFIKLAIDNLPNNLDKLPKRIAFFGINAMAPLWLDFINALSKHTQVHFFHLNPCADYWGDIQSEKQVFKQMDNWLAQDEIAQLVTNPLLANLGEQGKEFLSLLQNYSTINIDAYDDTSVDMEAENLTVLRQVQRDILTLDDARQTPRRAIDNSITITRAHSAMREIQGLHDWLLHQFNDDPSLTPKDVLVMCPEVEHYAPYVNAVFSRGWQELADDIPPLPCSIADRVSKNAEPIVAAFIELLRLPDSRFHVSQILAFLRVEQVKLKFGLDDDDIDKVSKWLERACVHWGLDENHKADILGIQQTNDHFTWHQALSRLIRGFAYQDEDVVFKDQLLLSQVEGQDAVLLGKLMHVMSLMKSHSQALAKPKHAEGWSTYLHQFVDDFFQEQEQSKLLILKDAINLLAQYTQDAQFSDTVSLAVVQSFLLNHFSVPDPGRQFMIGQVTFCSMVPMRSIPFKIIAVLGLNDGEFPRQRQPLSYDLMAQTPFKMGDRSRRGDDRYLFLEAIVSARQSLYLSYQGNSLKNNAEKQPSLVLKELMDYLSQGYGWQLFDEARDIRQLPMQPFSPENYIGSMASFDAKWFALGQSAQQPNDQAANPNQLAKLPIELTEIKIDLDELISFFEHPAKYFARHHLNLYLGSKQQLPEDIEPFEVSRLDAYQYRQALLEHYFECDGEDQGVAEQLYTKQRLSNRLPDLPSTSIEVERWQQDVDAFYQALQEQGLSHSKRLDIEFISEVSINSNAKLKVTLTGQVQLLEDQALVYRASEPKPKDMLRMLLTQCMLQAGNVSEHQQAQQVEVNQTRGIYFNTKTQSIEQYDCQQQANAYEILCELTALYVMGQQQPLLINLPLAEIVKKSKSFDQQAFEDFWHDSNLFKPFSDDEYMQYFWPTPPDIESLPEGLATVASHLSLVTKQKKARSKR